MKKKASRKKLMTPEQAEQLIEGADERFCPPEAFDERLRRLLGAAMQRKIHVRYLSVPVASLVPHVPGALEKARVNLVEEPSFRQNLLREMLGDSPNALLVYRKENGDLCSFDDYAALATAQEAKIEKVRVVVLGEGDEWYKMEDSPIHLG